jgi:predicted PhzF superfamily epimerase YddE/YHI9
MESILLGSSIQARKRERLGKNDLMAYQASKRGGQLKLRVEDERVFMTGQAVTVFEGTLYV